MINSVVKSLFRHSPNSLSYKSQFLFVKQQDIDDIGKNYGSTKFETFKKFAAISKHITFEGFKGFKSDFQLFRELKSKQSLTDNEIDQVIRINEDILKMGPLIIIQILPFSGPLFMLYMYTYPGSIPSWFLIDYYHDRHEQLKVRNQRKNLQFFQQLGLKPSEINLDTLSIRQLRKLTLLLFGYYRDGTIGYSKLFNKKINHLFFQAFSRFLIKRQLRKRFRRDLFTNQITDQMQSLDQMVRWKYQKIMNGQHILEYKPLYQRTIEKIKNNNIQEPNSFNQLQQQNKPEINDTLPPKDHSKSQNQSKDKK